MALDVLTTPFSRCGRFDQAREQCSSFIHLSLPPPPPPPPEFVPFLTAQKRVNSALLSFIFPSHHPPPPPEFVPFLTAQKRVNSALLSFIFPFPSTPPSPPEFVPFLTAQKRVNSALLSFIFPSHHSSPPPEFVPFLTAQKRVNSALLSFICAMPLVFWLFMIAVSLHRVQSIRQRLAYLLSHNGNNKYTIWPKRPHL